MDKLNQAIMFAARAHDGQKRKGTDIPYITHPFAVAMLLLREGCGEDTVIAGLLHDVVEDTPVTIEQLEAEFGAQVAAIVWQCTDDETISSWQTRKQALLERLKTAPLPVKYVACADKLHNISSIVADYAELGESLWARLGRGYAEHKWYYRALVDSILYGLEPDMNNSLFTRFRNKVAEFVALVELKNGKNHE
ncbi:MAG TPA: HD domain-containing protein [bacterium]|nr:HD domain-containing protein [bacterium]HPN44555.1 HD domain-containing protein [bacterium]